MNIAEHIILKFGGARQLADVMKPTPLTTIRSWGASGFIPAQHQQRVLDAARDNGVDLRESDFFQPIEASA